MIGIIAATRIEAEPLLKLLGAQLSSSDPFEVWEFDESAERPAGLLVISGIGRETAAAAASHLIDKCRATHVVNFGVCGALAGDIAPGSIFRAGTVVNGDAVLREEATQPCAGQLHGWDNLPVKKLATTGRPVFDADRRERLARTADLVDMEGFAVAEVCRRHSVPCWFIKGVTDRADASGKADILANLPGLAAELADTLAPALPGMRGRQPGMIVNILNFAKIEHSVFSLPLLLAGAWLGAGGRLPSWIVLALVAVAGVGARTLGMAMNRILDRRLDAMNRRTANRELPSGRMSPAQAWGVAAAGLLSYLAACAALGPACLKLSPIPAAALVGYSLLKRFTSLCHYGIGVCLGLAPLGAFVAASNGSTLSSPVMLLALFAFCWISGFDIIYSLQDMDSDRNTGVRSLPATLGASGALIVAAATHLVSVLAIAGLWRAVGQGIWPGVALGVAIAAFLAAYLPKIPLPLRFFPTSAVAGMAGAIVPLLGRLS